MLSNSLLQLEKYKIIETIDKGVYGQVYLVEDIETKAKYAAKVRFKTISSYKDQVSFFSEIEILSSAKNPAVLSLIGFNMQDFSHNNYPTIITPFMPKGSLRRLLKSEYELQSPTEWTKTMKYINLLGIAIGMEYLHSLQIVHRDLKPDNILLDENFYPYICDFGLSKLFNESLSQKVMDSFVGSPAYMAPEILREEKFTFKVDIYSFSIIAYELITGSCPSDGIGACKLMQNVINGKRPDLSKIPDKKIQDFLKKCWSNDPNERPIFSQIVETLCSSNFLDAFDADKNKVIDYLRLFPNHTILQNFLTSLSSYNGIPHDFKFIVSMIGSTVAGKTSICLTYKDGKARTSTSISIGFNFIDKSIKIDKGEFDTRIYDISNFLCNSVGLVDFKDYIHAIIIVVNVNNYDELEKVKNYIDLIKNCGFKCPVYIAAHQIDRGWKFSEEQLKEAIGDNDFPIFKTTINDVSSIDLMFKTVLSDLVQKYLDDPDYFKQPKEEQKSCSIF